VKEIRRIQALSTPEKEAKLLEAAAKGWMIEAETLLKAGVSVHCRHDPKFTAMISEFKARMRRRAMSPRVLLVAMSPLALAVEASGSNSQNYSAGGPRGWASI
jgi:hypothetical protein